ncbi:MAG: universal stress protein [Nitrospiraceae bacterium]|nr:universal stress protein [Nitrospiraceae bacterium]
MTRNMLVGFDASEESYQAFDYALSMAASYKFPPEITVLSVVQRPGGLNLVDTGSLIEETTRDFKVQLKTLEEKAKAVNLRISTEVVMGCPARAIVNTAKEKDCQFIIVGRKRRSKISRLLFGSVSRHVASEANCTVIVCQKGSESGSKSIIPALAPDY